MIKNNFASVNINNDGYTNYAYMAQCDKFKPKN